MMTPLPCCYAFSFRTTEGDVFVSYVVDLENSFTETMENMTMSFESALKVKQYKVHYKESEYTIEITPLSTSFSGKLIIHLHLRNKCMVPRHKPPNETPLHKSPLLRKPLVANL